MEFGAVLVVYYNWRGRGSCGEECLSAPIFEAEDGLFDDGGSWSVSLLRYCAYERGKKFEARSLNLYPFEKYNARGPSTPLVRVGATIFFHPIVS